ncbi:hypothetical protein [Pandoraea communis]|uniref:hypothetical protein n=1 Tax=Pandoraea communis TaxID=2508297 RepID=UPI0025A4F7B2|nr:hypothetical protein [Pandoraea communis]MDM8356554.1 hypothetical protein [Pandoraea communis]
MYSALSLQSGKLEAFLEDGALEMGTTTSAWRMLLQDNNVSGADAAMLTSLLARKSTGRGEQESSVLLLDLFAHERSNSGRELRSQGSSALYRSVERLKGLLDRPLSVRSETPQGAVVRAAPLVQTWTLTKEPTYSSVLRYTINVDLLTLLECVKMEQRLDCAF